MSPLPYLLLDLHDAGGAGCDRSLWSIIWACFLTLFACTWVAVHPNVPSPEHSASTVVARKIGMMLCMLLVPEMVITWAFGQFMYAKYYTHRIAVKRGKVEWTQTHSFFLIMGGFSYYAEEGAKSTTRVREDEIGGLYDKGLIEWPKVALKEIQDHSKADFLSKFIVVTQTTWFSLQFIVRLASGLTATELEVSTFAFAVLNVVVYGLWRNKPFDVRSPIVIPGKYSPRPECIAESLPSGQAESVTPALSQTTINPDSITSEPTLTPEAQHNNHTPFLADATESTQKKPRQILSTLSGFWTTSLQACASFLINIMKGLFGYFNQLIIVSENDYEVRSLGTWWAKGIIQGEFVGVALLGLVGAPFGAIHFIAWNFHFPTATEMWLWRSSSIALTASPILFVGSGIMNGIIGNDVVIDLVTLPSMILYTISRIILIILPLIALRDPAPGVFVNINWTSLLPHF
ncbi:hypothetical protein BJ165DRAFT_1409443 [Panaeolus papilionaceus]|nr:hypothetical protein BJ165DRAFT_1409443 [Panaeolus papilionaceus]